jgi:hypothetical protein
LTSTPANDFISPGVGQTTKLYSLYMPITASKPTSTIEKNLIMFKCKKDLEIMWITLKIKCKFFHLRT